MMADLFVCGPDGYWRRFKPSDITPYESLYKSAQSRLLADRLIGRSVAQLRDRQAQERENVDFEHWQRETEFPQYIDQLTTTIGESVK